MRWLPRKDSNLVKEIQNLLCYRYTTRQSGGGESNAQMDRCKWAVLLGIRFLQASILGRKWLPRKDSNLNKENQNLLCYRYTTRQLGG